MLHVKFIIQSVLCVGGIWSNTMVPVTYFYSDSTEFWGLFFQDDITPQTEKLAELHNDIMYYSAIVLFAVTWIMVSIVINFRAKKNKIPSKHNHIVLQSNSPWVTLGAAFFVISQVVLGITYIGSSNPVVDHIDFASPQFLARILPQYDILNRNEPGSPGYNSEMYAAAYLLDTLTMTINRLTFLIANMQGNVPHSEVVSLYNYLHEMMFAIEHINNRMVEWFHDIVIEGVDPRLGNNDDHFEAVQHLYEAYVRFEVPAGNLGRVLDRAAAQIDEVAYQHRIETQDNEIDNNADIRHPATLTLCIYAFVLAGMVVLAGSSSGSSSPMSLDL